VREDLTRIIVDWSGSWQAARPGNWPGSEPCDEGGLGLLSDPMGRNRVKPEQASKVLMRMPTLRSFGEGRTRGEAIDTRTHAIRRGSGHGTSEGWFAVTGGDPSRTRVAASASHQAVVTAGVGRGNRSVDAE
jgi:hypothetical protein